MEPLHDLFAELTHARNRIAELEGKLKIATENCAQAVKERDEWKAEFDDEQGEHLLSLRNLDNAMTKLEAMEPRLAAAEAVCERVYEILVPYADPKITHLLVQWRELKEKQ